MSTTPVRVLLVEDSPSDAQLLQERLREASWERFDVTHVERLEEAIARLRAEPFDVVLLDLSLPDSAGHGTYLRVRREAPHVPLVVLSGAYDEMMGIEAVRHGIQDYLVKGQTDQRHITHAIRYAIERKRMEEAPASAGKEPKVSVGITPLRTAAVAGAEGRIRIVLVDDHVLMRQGLARLLREERDMEIVGEASDGASAVSLVRETQPDIVLMDVNMPGMNGTEATRIIHAELPGIQVIGLSMFEEAELATAMRKAGAVNYLSKSGASNALIAAIRACATGLGQKSATGASC